MILKVNQYSDSANFRSGVARFKDQQERSPGPAAYPIQKDELRAGIEKKKRENLRHS